MTRNLKIEGSEDGERGDMEVDGDGGADAERDGRLPGFRHDAVLRGGGQGGAGAGQLAHGEGLGHAPAQAEERQEGDGGLLHERK